jgi:hypothetical protein
VPKERLDLKVQKAIKVTRVRQAPKALKELPVRQVLKDRKAIQE